MITLSSSKSKTSTSTSAGQVCSKMGMMAELNKHVTQVVMAGDDITTPFAGSSMVANVVKSCARV